MYDGSILHFLGGGINFLPPQFMIVKKVENGSLFSRLKLEFESVIIVKLHQLRWLQTFQSTLDQPIKPKRPEVSQVPVRVLNYNYYSKISTNSTFPLCKCFLLNQSLVQCELFILWFISTKCLHCHFPCCNPCSKKVLCVVSLWILSLAHQISTLL